MFASVPIVPRQFMLLLMGGVCTLAAVVNLFFDCRPETWALLIACVAFFGPLNYLMDRVYTVYIYTDTVEVSNIWMKKKTYPLRSLQDVCVEPLSFYPLNPYVRFTFSDRSYTARAFFVGGWGIDRFVTDLRKKLADAGAAVTPY